MQRPRFKFHISYQMIVGALVTIAMILAGGYLIISYIYQIQDETNVYIQHNVESAKTAQELKLSLYNIRAASLTYLFDRSPERIAALQQEQTEFIVLLDKAREATNTTEENNLIQQISALFSNYQQTLKNALELHRQGRISQPNKLIVHASQDLINTIEEKTNLFIASKESAQMAYEKSIRKNDDIIRTAIFTLGIGGIFMGLILGWLIARLILNPIYKLVLKVRDAAGSEVVEHIRMTPGKELEELDLHINRLIGRINKANEDLKRNRELLEKTSKLAAVGKIAPVIAHEIRNPLTAIKMLIYSMMQEPGVSEEKEVDYKIIAQEINRVEGFLQNFLKYARPTKPQMQQIDIVHVIRETMHLMQPKIVQNNITLTEQYEKESLQLLADPDMIRQVLMNLVLNALEAMGIEGQLVVATRVSENKENGNVFEISLSDTGSGIPDDIRDSLFDPFVKGKDQGVGLGLSISQRIAELHQGWISAENNAGKGSVFTIHLPIKS
ncbi:MAG: MCP four helix bundle domain-containing protein [Bacteroidales bacterium]|nr:MCP four helix bundle domain-containing protein [Bacteroidales bacterium]